MAEIRILHAEEELALACRIAAALAGEGHSVSRADTRETASARPADALLVIWSPSLPEEAPFLAEARAALASRRLIPIVAGKAAPPASFAHLTPIDLSGWTGANDDARWRFVVDELDLVMRQPSHLDADLYFDEELAPEPAPYMFPIRIAAGGAAGLAVLAVAALAAATLSGEKPDEEPAVLFAVKEAAPRAQAAAPVDNRPAEAPVLPEEAPAAEQSAEAAEAAISEEDPPAPSPIEIAEAALPEAALNDAAPPPMVKLPTPPADDFAGVVFRDCIDCPDMAEIPAAPNGALGHFALSRREVTFLEWQACLADGGCGGRLPEDLDFGRGARPVINVSYAEAQGYVAWLSKKTGRSYRLPSEAEWEYAARAGAADPYAYGATLSPTLANYDGALVSDGAEPVNLQMSVPVASYPANAFGLYDVHGNVAEWVADCFSGGGPSCGTRVVKGGGYQSDPTEATASYRSGAAETAREPWIGFRVARDLD